MLHQNCQIFQAAKYFKNCPRSFLQCCWFAATIIVIFNKTIHMIVADTNIQVKISSSTSQMLATLPAQSSWSSSWSWSWWSRDQYIVQCCWLVCTDQTRRPPMSGLLHHLHQPHHHLHHHLNKYLPYLSGVFFRILSIFQIFSSKTNRGPVLGHISIEEKRRERGSSVPTIFRLCCQHHCQHSCCRCLSKINFYYSAIPPISD